MLKKLGLIALALGFDAAAGLVGGLLSERWLKRHLGALVGFAAGALIAVAFLDLLPESMQRLGPVGMAVALASFSASFIDCRRGRHRRKPCAAALHNSPDPCAAETMHGGGA